MMNCLVAILQKLNYIMKLQIPINQMIPPHNLFGNQPSQSQQEMKSAISQKINKTQLMIKNFQNSLANPHKVDFLEAIISESKVTYIDSHKEYVVVRSQYFEQLQRLKAEIKMWLGQQNEKNKLSTQSKIQSLLNVQKNQESSQFQRYKKQTQHKIQSMKSVLDQYKQENIKQAQNINILSRQNKKIMSQYQKVCQEALQKKKRNRNRNYVNKDVQTQYEIQDIEEEMIKNKNKIGEDQSKEKNTKSDRQIQQLKDRFKLIVGNIQEQMARKIQELQNTFITLENLERQNENIKTQNALLRQKLYQIDQKQKLGQIWKQSIHNFLQKIDHQAKEPSSMMAEEEINPQENSIISQGESSYNGYAAKQKIRILQQRMLELIHQKVVRDKKIKQIEKILEVNQQEISDEGIVANMLKLSSKIKESIKFLLEQI